MLRGPLGASLLSEVPAQSACSHRGSSQTGAGAGADLGAPPPSAEPAGYAAWRVEEMEMREQAWATVGEWNSGGRIGNHLSRGLSPE